MSGDDDNLHFNLESSPTKSLVSIPDTDDKLNISFFYAVDDSTELKSKFALSQYEIFSHSHAYSKKNFSGYSHDFFANCGSQISCIDFIQNDLYPSLGDSILILVGTSSINQYLESVGEYHTYVHLYVLNFCASDPKPDQPIVDLSFLCLTPIKNDDCVRLKWVKINYVTGYLFAVILLKGGCVKLCRFNVASLSKLLKSDEPASKRVLEPDYLWQFDRGASGPRRFTCFDISYNVNDALITLACGSNDGFVDLWNFNLSLFQSFSSESADSEYIPSHKKIQILYGMTSNLLTREITEISFLPLPNSYVLAVGTFLKGLILWDTRFSQLEGEIRTYNIGKPITCVTWTPNSQYVLVGASTGMLLEWQTRHNTIIVSYEKLTKSKSSNLLDNICWSAHASEDAVYFAFDSGETIEIKTSNVLRKSIKEDAMIFKWKLDVEGTKPPDEFPPYKTSPSHIESINNAITAKFLQDWSNAKKYGVTVTKCFEGVTVDEPQTHVRNKVFALTTLVRSLLM
ncbi:uncharacterized protein TOT_010000263 [Theileria orientalis strain Shintoku]|uniref:Uncharacterized protein n=1 Tax=Theileria orientalis strain Shintoku TaxID=869250 RepID=J7M4M5_THEOR|nr:uncharacterized protein TOT_010000263 [Theileria orientalis strain Shintoku]BAM38795.1 uncharacterized protein TOT_010000263 [Theileria orientalis strain Shintoku]|eukprot:XP_009689096.1 uncharacterized protein TOT_010000263 [Theileria orientalis strain Shintoku]